MPSGAAGVSVFVDALGYTKMASQTTVRIDAATHRTLKALRRQTGETTPEILRRALEEDRRKHFLDGLAADFAAVRNDAKGSADERAERALWDATTKDGFEE